MRIHESWREEIGWFLVILGAAAFLFALIEAFARGFASPASNSPWVGVAVGAVVVLVGLALHATRPSRRRLTRGPGEPLQEMPPDLTHPADDQHHQPAH